MPMVLEWDVQQSNTGQGFLQHNESRHHTSSDIKDAFNSIWWNYILMKCNTRLIMLQVKMSSDATSQSNHITDLLAEPIV